MLKLLIATPWIVLYLINYITREKNYANIKSKRYLSTTGGDAELVFQNLAGSRCPFQPLFTKERRSAQVNESKQLPGQTRPHPPNFNDDVWNFKDMVFLELPNPAVNNIEIGGRGWETPGQVSFIRTALSWSTRVPHWTVFSKKAWKHCACA